MNIRVLLVDDYEDFRKQFCESFANEGWTIETASTGEQSLRKMKQSMQTNAYHVVFLDIAMPYIDGYDVLASLEKEGILEHFYIIAITGEVIREKAVEVISLGADYFLDKSDLLNKPALVQELVKKGYKWQCLRRQKIQAQKEQEQLAFWTAHEMGNYYSSINSATDKLCEYVKNDEAGSKEIDYIRDALSRIKVLRGGLRGLIDSLTIKESDKTAVDVRKVIENAIAFSRRGNKKLESDIEIIRDVKPQIPEVWASGTALESIFVNLISNAVKAMPDGGTLTIRIFCSTPNHVVIAVSDTGMGIRPKKLENIWKVGYPDWPPDLHIQGTGLGLPMCKKTAEAHQGIIDIDSELKKGTTVTVKLPVVPQRDTKLL